MHAPRAHGGLARLGRRAVGGGIGAAQARGEQVTSAALDEDGASNITTASSMPQPAPPTPRRRRWQTRLKQRTPRRSRRPRPVPPLQRRQRTQRAQSCRAPRSHRGRNAHLRRARRFFFRFGAHRAHDLARALARQASELPSSSPSRARSHSVGASAHRAPGPCSGWHTRARRSWRSRSSSARQWPPLSTWSPALQ